MQPEMKSCVICGTDWSDPDDLIDTLYPSNFNPNNLEFDEWNVVCQIHNTGCGREVYGTSKEEAVTRWNNGWVDNTVDILNKKRGL